MNALESPRAKNLEAGAPHPVEETAGLEAQIADVGGAGRFEGAARVGG